MFKLGVQAYFQGFGSSKRSKSRASSKREALGPKKKKKKKNFWAFRTRPVYAGLWIKIYGQKSEQMSFFNIIFKAI